MLKWDGVFLKQVDSLWVAAAVSTLDLNAQEHGKRKQDLTNAGNNVALCFLCYNNKVQELKK
jgi:hypothetical protein